MKRSVLFEKVETKTNKKRGLKSRLVAVVVSPVLHGVRAYIVYVTCPLSHHHLQLLFKKL